MKRVYLLMVLALITLFPAFSQQGKIAGLEFRDKPIADILLTLGELAHISVVSDDTVQGNVSYYFAEASFDPALRKFAISFGLSIEILDGIYYISRIEASFDRTTGKARLMADEVPLPMVVRKFSKTIGKTILFDSAPEKKITIHAENIDPSAIVAILAKFFPDASLETTDSSCIPGKLYLGISLL